MDPLGNTKRIGSFFFRIVMSEKRTVKFRFSSPENFAISSFIFSSKSALVSLEINGESSIFMIPDHIWLNFFSFIIEFIGGKRGKWSKTCLEIAIHKFPLFGNRVLDDFRQIWHNFGKYTDSDPKENSQELAPIQAKKLYELILQIRNKNNPKKAKN